TGPELVFLLVSQSLSELVFYRSRCISNFSTTQNEAANETEKETSDETEEETINSELQNDRQRPFYVTKKYDLPIERLFPQSHYSEYREDKGSCVWCHFKTMSEQGKHNKNSPRGQV
ncbi:613_t:CDS:2, partial [Gigaspora rosea]